MPAVLWRLGVTRGGKSSSVDREHLRVRTSTSDASVYPGNRFTLFIEVEPLPGVHVYGPQVGGGYQRLEVAIDPLPYLTGHPPRYPTANTLTLPWTDESLTGYAEPVRVAIDVSLDARQELAPVLEAGRGLTVAGTLRVQACDDRVCWAPEAISLSWHVDLRPPDLERSPEPLQHRPKAN
ncbi:MAG: protein-disulfide reductase DsbD domain-containing protein [bacterium]